MSEQTAHYESAVTGEIVPEDELLEVPIYVVETEGHGHFNTEIDRTEYIEKGKVNSAVVGVELLVAHGKLISVYREDSTYGRAYSSNDSHVDSELWEGVIDD